VQGLGVMLVVGQFVIVLYADDLVILITDVVSPTEVINLCAESSQWQNFI
jgi:hypothetical protein